ncbi:hypothetical protein [Pasteuria penetrans]|uniref:hypothetical protein n=1 Tax=Pasteuria penetrans TaxID=86005 RepID=UPI0011F04A97|nr:hypothetical protein [Pasteuria penetrans]
MLCNEADPPTAKERMPGFGDDGTEKATALTRFPTFVDVTLFNTVLLGDTPVLSSELNSMEQSDKRNLLRYR